MYFITLQLSHFKSHEFRAFFLNQVHIILEVLLYYFCPNNMEIIWRREPGLLMSLQNINEIYLIIFVPFTLPYFIFDFHELKWNSHNICYTNVKLVGTCIKGIFSY